MITINNIPLHIKKYYCAKADGKYIEKKDNRLWLYVCITDYCPGKCPFCVNRCTRTSSAGNSFDLSQFKRIFEQILPWIDGVSITGGEPLADIKLLAEVTRFMEKTLPDTYELDLVTSGYELEKLLEIDVSRYSTIHLSRHRVKDEDNSKIIGSFAPPLKEVERVLGQLPDKGAAVLNCVLSDDGVRNTSMAAEYLDMADSIGIENTSFIGMFLVNDYCRRHYVSPKDLKFNEDRRFRIWDTYHDYKYCSCSSGDYRSRYGLVRFYYRCPGTETSDYCRQLVYSADNHLRAGFGNSKIII